MLPSRNLPASFDRVLSPVRGCFTQPSFQTFVVLFCGFVSAVGERTELPGIFRTVNSVGLRCQILSVAGFFEFVRRHISECRMKSSVVVS